MGGQSIVKNPRKVYSQQSETDPTINTRITTLENHEFKVAYFESVSATTGTVSPPTGATILLDQYAGGVDAYVSTVNSGQPTGKNPVTAVGTVIDVSSFDASGNYTLTGTPSSYPVAIIYVFKIKILDWDNLTLDNIVGYEETKNLHSDKNLSDLSSAQSARTNLGLETGANGGNTNYSIGTERLSYTGTAFTAARTWTLPDSTGFNSLHEKIVSDILQTITSINTLTVGVQSGKKLNGITNGTVIMTTPGAARRFWPDGSGGWCYDAGLERVSKRQNFYTNVVSTTTGSTSETVVANIPINANPMGANGWIDIDMFLSKSTSVGNCTWKVYLATVGTYTVGSTSVPSAIYQLGQTTLASTTQAARFFRRMVNQNSQSSQVVYPTTASSNTDIGNITSAWSTRAIDTSASTWLVITVTASNASDTLGIQAASASTTYNS